MIANPSYSITIDEGLALPHEPMISEDDWIRANVNLLSELGPSPYLATCCPSSRATTPAGSPADAALQDHQPGRVPHTASL
jgi:hypothetical protein